MIANLLALATLLAPPIRSASTIIDPDVGNGVTAAIKLNMIPSAAQKVYPGHFYINADGGGYGSDATWPGLDSWQMAGAYLLIGKTQIVLDYFDFVCASQRKDGNIPFAIFTGDTQAGDTYLRGLKNPGDRFTYVPPKRPKLTASSQETRQWVGLFQHWETETSPLATLGPICFLLTAREINDATQDGKWLKAHLPMIEKTGDFLASQITANGLMSGSGFYTERPPRNGWDGVTQCYAVKAFHDLEALESDAKNPTAARKWKAVADQITRHFSKLFWRGDHFAEYIHPTHGVVDSHGLSDTNWAAIAFGLASKSQTKKLWPKLVAAKEFWPGGMPTTTVINPTTYEDWEHEKVPFAAMSNTNDVAAMGRSWYVEALACKRMGDRKRLLESARAVSLAADHGYWRERYHPLPGNKVQPDGSEKYCEYPAVLIRVVYGNPDVFFRR